MKIDLFDRFTESLEQIAILVKFNNALKMLGWGAGRKQLENGLEFLTRKSPWKRTIYLHENFMKKKQNIR